MEGPTLSFDYPSGWEDRGWDKANREGTAQEITMSPESLMSKYIAPFDTRWDRSEDTRIDVQTELKSKLPEPHDWLLSVQKAAKKKEQTDLRKTTIAGHEAWVYSEPYHHEDLDIGLPPQPGFFKAIYLAFYGGEATEILAVFRTGDRTYQIRYILPGDKIARKRYERVYSRLIDSLVIKG
jgi:hypothetical protein